MRIEISEFDQYNYESKIVRDRGRPTIITLCLRMLEAGF